MYSPTLWLGQGHHLVVLVRRDREKEEELGAIFLQGLARAPWLKRWEWSLKLQGSFNRISNHDSLRGLNEVDDSAYPPLDLDLDLALSLLTGGRGIILLVNIIHLQMRIIHLQMRMAWKSLCAHCV